MAQKTQCQVETKPLAAVALVGYSHGTSYVLLGTTTVLGKNSQKTTAINLVIFDQMRGCIGHPSG
jgi:hypothetical protein